MSTLAKNELSILIPTHNYVCVKLVEDLQRQARQLGISYEIVVADDGSTDEECVRRNRDIERIPGAIYIIRCKNVGRAAIRNVLTRQSRYAWLLFLDCDLELPDGDFLRRYVTCPETGVIDGGLRIGGRPELRKHNLRYMYEKREEPRHTASQRQLSPYRSFRTTNFMAPREVMTAHPFDERFRRYGYEDVLFGKELRTGKVGITHIDNPMVLTDYEPNDVFVRKTEEGLQTLRQFSSELRGYSTLLTAVGNISHVVPVGVIRLWHVLFGRLERRLLCCQRPCLRLFNIYKLGYYISLNQKQ